VLRFNYVPPLYIQRFSKTISPIVEIFLLGIKITIYTLKLTLHGFVITSLYMYYQSEHIGQWATPHHRRLGGIGRVVPIDVLQ